MPWLAWIAGLSAAVGPMVWSGLRMISSSRGDPRLVNYTLEHGYRWLAGHPLHASFWDPPIFHPIRNVSAFTDVLLGAGPLYWPWRLAGLAPDTSFQLWSISVWSLNFLAALLLLRRSFGFPLLASTAGAYLFAFGNPRLSHAGHPQLIPHFAVLLGVASLVGMFREQQPRRRRRWWIAAFVGAVVIQAYTAFYVLFLFAVMLLLAGAAALLRQDTRRRMADIARRDAWWLVAAALATLLLIAPLASHYLQSARELGLRRIEEDLMARPASWVLMGPRNILYGWVQKPRGLTELSSPHHSNGLGPVTTVVVLAGLWRLRRRRSIMVLLVAAASMVVLFTAVGPASPWYLAREVIPGAKALRAVGRVGLVMLLPGAVGLASAAAWLERGRRRVILAVLVLVCGAEQLQSRGWIAKDHLRQHMAEIAERIDPSCESFYLVCTGPADCRNTPVDAMWAQMMTRIPTVNGRYGNQPPGYRLLRAQARTPTERRELETQLGRWTDIHHLAPETICWVEYPGYEPRGQDLVRLP